MSDKPNKHEPSSTTHLLHMAQFHPNPVTRSVYMMMVGNRIDRVLRDIGRREL